MTHLPIKVRILLNEKGANLYPNFNALPLELRGGLDWAHFIDVHGTGWHYDKVCGHAETDVGNPQVADDDAHRCEEIGVWHGCMCVPAAFAEAAAAMFPGEVTILTEASFEAFYDQRAHAHEPEVFVDRDAVDAVNSVVELESKGTLPAPSAARLAGRAEVLNPESSVPGIRRNMKKRWADYKARAGITISPAK